MIFLALRVKLGLMKMFVKTMDKTRKAYLYLSTKISSLCEAKIKDGIFVGPQIRKSIYQLPFFIIQQVCNYKIIWNQNKISCNFVLSVWRCVQKYVTRMT